MAPITIIRRKDTYLVRGKGIETEIHTSPARNRFWLLPGAMCAIKDALNLKEYRRKVWELRRDAISKNLLVEVGDFYLVTETLIFDTVSDATGFILGSSRSGDVAKKGKKNLTGKNLRGNHE